LHKTRPLVEFLVGGGQGRKVRGENGRNYMRVRREEIGNWPGPSGVMKRTEWWPSGQVWIDNVLSDASYVL
jgi:hypothetical protein